MKDTRQSMHCVNHVTLEERMVHIYCQIATMNVQDHVSILYTDFLSVENILKIVKSQDLYPASILQCF